MAYTLRQPSGVISGPVFIALTPNLTHYQRTKLCGILCHVLPDGGLRPKLPAKAQSTRIQQGN